MVSDFERWPKDSPYGISIGRPCHRENRPFVPREPTVLRGTGPHLFGVCCIIRTRELATRESALSIFFLRLPAPWKTSFGNILRNADRVAGRFRDCTLPSDRPTGTSANTWPGGKDGSLSASGEMSRNSCLFYRARTKHQTMFRLPSRPLVRRYRKRVASLSAFRDTRVENSRLP